MTSSRAETGTRVAVEAEPVSVSVAAGAVARIGETAATSATTTSPLHVLTGLSAAIETGAVSKSSES